MKHAGGRPAEPVRLAWAPRFGLTAKQKVNILTVEMCWQLCWCKDDTARRLLVGVSS